MGSVALVTGASSGIGKEIVKRLLSDGYTVYGAARRLDKMSDLAERGVITIKMDVTVGEDVAAGIAAITAAHGGVDVLVNNAGFGSYGAMEDTTIEDAKYQFDVNIFGLARLTQAVLPHMREAKSGSIVNISSMGGRIHTPLGSWYHATKFALEGWSDCLRIEVARFGVKVILIEPGIIRTDFGSELIGPMMERSGSSAYAPLAKAVAATTKKAYAPDGSGSPPSVVADAVSKALAAKRPKARYIVGRLARLLIFVRRWFGARLFDKLVMSKV